MFSTLGQSGDKKSRSLAATPNTQEDHSNHLSLMRKSYQFSFPILYRNNFHVYNESQRERRRHFTIAQQFTSPQLFHRQHSEANIPDANLGNPLSN
jgi:hypothetical protein